MFRSTITASGIHFALSSNQSGRLELLAPDGKIIASKAFPAGTTELLMPTPNGAGILDARLVQGTRMETAKIFVTH